MAPQTKPLAVKPAEKNNSVIAAPAANVTEQVKKSEAKDTTDPDTVESKITRVYDLHDTVQKLETLYETRKDLKSFKTSANGLSSTLSLRDANGKTFSTSNTEAIALLVDELKNILDKKISETEAQITL